MKSVERLGIDPLGPLVLRFSLPVVTGLVVNALYNLVDRIFVGRGVGPTALAGITVSFPLFIIISATGMLFGLGAASVISLSLGRSDRLQAEKAVGTALTASIVVAVLATGVGYLVMEPILIAFGGSGEVLEQARRFTAVALLGFSFQVIGLTMNSAIRAQGDPAAAFAMTLSGATINVVLNPLFIFVLEWGIAGSALATTLGEAISCIWAVAYFFGGGRAVPLRLANLRPDLRVLRRISAVGVAPCCMQLALCLVMAISNNVVGARGGQDGIACMGIIYVIYPLILLPLAGLGAGVQPIIGYNYGAGLPGRVHRTLWITLLTATVFCSVAGAAILAGSEWIVRLFGMGDPSLLAMGRRALRVFFALLPLVGLQVVGAHYFQAVGRAGVSFLNHLLRQVVILIPVLLVLPRFTGLDGVWLANPISDGSSAVITGLFVVVELRRLRAMAQDTSRAAACVFDRPGLGPDGAAPRKESLGPYGISSADT